VLNRDGKETMPIMGCYGIGIERILTAAIETSAATSEGASFALPAAIAPFEIVVTITNVGDAALLAAGEKVATDLEAAGFDVLLDDRDERGRSEVQRRRPRRNPLSNQHRTRRRGGQGRVLSIGSPTLTRT